MKMVVALVLCVLAFLLQNAQGRQANDPIQEYSLRSTLSQHYDDIRRQIVPRPAGSSDPLDVQFGMTLINILDFDEQTNVISIMGWHKMAWNDANLRWDPEHYGGINLLRMSSDLIWRPDLILYNSLKLGTGQFEPVMAVVYSDGNVLYIPPAINKVKCDRVKPDDDDDDRIVPDDDDVSEDSDDDDDVSEHHDDDHDHDSHDHGEDRQHSEWECTLKFGSWTYDGFVMDMSLYNNATGMDTDSLIPNEKYEVVSTHAQKEVKYYACCPEPYVDILFKLKIRCR